MNHRPVVLGVLLASAAAAPALAQVTPNSMVAGGVQRDWNVNLAGTVEYDNNVTRGVADVTLPGALKPEDVTYAPSLSVDIVNPIGRQALFLRGTASYLFHERNTRLDHSRFNLAGGLGGAVGPCGAVLGGSYARSRAELDDRTLVERVDNLLQVTGANVSVSCIRPPGLGVILTASRAWGENSLASTRENDFETTNASAGLQYGRPDRSSISLVGTYALTEYSNRPSFTGETPGYETVGVLLAGERRLGARIQGSASVGYTKVEVLDPTPVPPGATLSPITDYDMVTYSGSVTFRASSRLTVEAAFGRQVAPTLITEQSYEVQTNYSLSARYRLGTRLQVSASYEQSDRKARGGLPPNPALEPSLTDATIRAYVASVTYRQTRRLSFALRAQHEERSANDPRFEYGGERYSFTTQVSF